MNEIEKTNQMAIVSEAGNNNLIAQLPPDAVRPFFAMCFGRPDSLSKVINRKFKIIPHDLVNLNNKICRLLETHNVVAKAASITIKFSENKIVSLANWSEFINFDWTVPETVKYVELRWDFIIDTKLYASPQRHSLSVKISNDIRPLDVFRMMASSSTSEKEFEASIALCYINVDFIYHTLANELIHIVSEWTEALPLIADENKFWNFAKEKKEIIARFIHYSLPAMFFFCIVILLYFKGNTVLVRNNDILTLFCAIALLNFSIFVGKFFATKVYSSLDAYDPYSPFDFSSGDKNYLQKIQNENKKRIRNAIFSFILNLLLNLLCAVLTTCIVK